MDENIEAEEAAGGEDDMGLWGMKNSTTYCSSPLMEGEEQHYLQFSTTNRWEHSGSTRRRWQGSVKNHNTFTNFSTTDGGEHFTHGTFLLLWLLSNEDHAE